MKISSVLYAAIASVGVALAAIMPAQAFSVTFGEDSQSSNNPATGASAFVDFMFSDVSGGVQLTANITNTTGSSSFGAGATTSKLTGIAFDLISGVGIDTNSFNTPEFLDTLLTNVDFNPFSNSVGNFDIAFADNNNFEGGNANGALSEGNSTLASIVLTTGLGANAVEQAFFNGFSNGSLNFAARFQQVNAGAGSDKLLGGTINGGTTDPEPVPEPFTILGSVTALGVGTLLKRKANKA
ncbi:MAG: PEP-CTERM sorting domain-containing protein [Lyngbya sp.]|nr:PEP-CTERM sorting domain-containing protein [Lyngbya sp.]